MTGDCFRKCVAHILTRPLDEMPVANSDFKAWYASWKAYLKQFGLGLVWISGSGPAPEGYAILALAAGPGKSHAVVMRDSVMVYEPNPENTGHSEGVRLRWYVFTVLEPREMIR